MANPSQDPAAKLKPLVDQERRLQGPGHPSPQHISAYHDGQLGPDETDRLQQHLAFCPQCTQILLGLERFREDLAAEAAVADEDLPDPQQEAAWQILRERVAKDFAASRSKGRSSRPSAAPARPVIVAKSPASGATGALGATGTGTLLAPGPSARSGALVAYRRAVFLLAAGLVGCLIGFPLWTARALRQAENRAVVAYLPDGSVTRGSGDTVLKIQLGDANVVVVLPVITKDPYPTYRIEVLGGNGNVVLTRPPIAGRPTTPSAQGSDAADPILVLTLTLSRGELPAGDYRIHVSGVRDSKPEVLTETRVQITVS